MMELNSIKPADGAKHAKRRVGRGIGSGPDEDIPDALLERVGLTRDKANDVVSKVLEAEVLLRELASQFSQA